MTPERLVEALELYCQAMDNAVQVLKQALAKIGKAPVPGGVSEHAFDILKWEASKGSRLGEFEVGFKASNLPDQWNQAFNILKGNNATIKNHFGPDGFDYYYWLYLDKYDDRIFRKKRETAS